MVHRQFLYPQEVEAFYILPALRRYLVIYLKEKGLKQKDIALLLGVHQAAISQYVKEKRGHAITFDEDILKEIKDSAGRIHDRGTLLLEMQHLVNIVRQTRVLCQVHKMFSDVPSGCDPLTVGCTSPQGGLVHVNKT
jgi:uncharacterized protein